MVLENDGYYGKIVKTGKPRSLRDREITLKIIGIKEERNRRIADYTFKYQKPHALTHISQ
ncbi:hypothetical protein ACSAZL_21270 [Methanosarcina sp. T3]|uniref:hypothetical protein n=1 Tax=Methanosarcina sp. T3 TaxID=3439062 RepID=UPI003F85FDE5